MTRAGRHWPCAAALFVGHEKYAMSLGSAAIIVAVVSAVLTGVWCWLRRDGSAWFGAVGMPFVVSYCVYWWPVWFGAGSSAEHAAWAVLGVGVPFVAGVIPSALVAALFGSRRAN